MHRAFTSLTALAAILLLAVPAAALTYTDIAGDADGFTDRDAFDILSGMDFYTFGDSGVNIDPASIRRPAAGGPGGATIAWSHTIALPGGAIITGATLTLYHWDIEVGENTMQIIDLDNAGATAILGPLNSVFGAGTDASWVAGIGAGLVGDDDYDSTAYALGTGALVANGTLDVTWSIPAGSNFALAVDYAVLEIEYEGETTGGGEVPEPTSLALLGLGLAGLGVATRRRRRNRS